jgi:hypothetical protein
MPVAHASGRLGMTMMIMGERSSSEHFIEPAHVVRQGSCAILRHTLSSRPSWWYVPEG